MMNNRDSKLFTHEENVLKDAEELIKRESYNNDILREKLVSLIGEFGTMLKELKKLVKISDGQQRYLQQIQNTLEKEIGERISAEEKLKLMATTDALTGVYNRGTGLSILENLLKNLRRNGSVISICYIDINELKFVNDRFGHVEGDRHLVSLCNYINQSVRDCDIVARLGGDEFIIVFPQCTKANAENIVGRITAEVAVGNRTQGEQHYPVSFSFGIIEIDEHYNMNADELIDLADRKMYEHKEQNKTSR